MRAGRGRRAANHRGTQRPPPREARMLSLSGGGCRRELALGRPVEDGVSGGPRLAVVRPRRAQPLDQRGRQTVVAPYVHGTRLPGRFVATCRAQRVRWRRVASGATAAVEPTAEGILEHACSDGGDRPWSQSRHVLHLVRLLGCCERAGRYVAGAEAAKHGVLTYCWSSVSASPDVARLTRGTCAIPKAWPPRRKGPTRGVRSGNGGQSQESPCRLPML